MLACPEIKNLNPQALNQEKQAVLGFKLDLKEEIFGQKCA